MHLVIIEAPGKLKSCGPFSLHSSRRDLAGRGDSHRDLPVHGQDPQMLTVGVGQDFKPHYDPFGQGKDSHG